MSIKNISCTPNNKFSEISLFLVLIIFLLSTLLPSCTSDDLAFEVIESPVLAVFSEETDTDMLRMTATFYELDKSGILDKNIGIDSTIISGLSLEIFINEKTLVGSATTDGSGQATLETTISDLQGASRLEWVGTYNNTPFRIYRNF